MESAIYIPTPIPTDFFTPSEHMRTQTPIASKKQESDSDWIRYLVGFAGGMIIVVIIIVCVRGCIRKRQTKIYSDGRIDPDGTRNPEVRVRSVSRMNDL